MRSFLLTSLLIVLSVVPAAACPERAHCLTRLAAAAVADEAPAAKPPKLPSLAPTLPARSPLDRELAIHRVPRKPDVEMPWIWQVIARQAHDSLPSYEQHRVSMTVAPVVVAGTFDTVPGLGLYGDF